MASTLEGPAIEPAAGGPARQLVVLLHGYGYQWFRLIFRDPHECARGVRQAAPRLDAYLDAELERRGLDDSALAHVGFSQGTMLALHVAPRRKAASACVIGFSGHLADA